jgi:hypothetical protein
LFQYAVRHYHKDSDNRAVGIEYLERKFREHFSPGSRTEQRLVEFMDQLVNYFISYERLGNHAIEAGINVSVDLGENIYVCGEVFRVDLVTKGNVKYAVYLLIKEDYSWETELRMPLLQKHFSSIYGCSVDQISIGVYCFTTNRHESICFGQKEIAKADREMRHIRDAIVLEEKKIKKKRK